MADISQGIMRIKNVNSNLLLDVDDGPGTIIQKERANGRQGHQWRMTTVLNGFLSLASLSDSNVLTAVDGWILAERNAVPE